MADYYGWNYGYPQNTAPQGGSNFGSSLTLPSFNPDMERLNLMAMLDAPGKSPYTPELTADMEAGIRRRAREGRDTVVAGAQSDALARGGTGSSTELLALNDARVRGGQAEEDQVMNFMLGVADRAADERRFRVGTGLDLY